jgi:hypothetical protein
MFRSTIIMLAALLLLSNNCAPSTPLPQEPAELTIPEPRNQSPIIKFLNAPSKFSISSTSEIVCVADDPDGNELTYSWTASSGRIAGQGAVVNWTAPVAAGDCTIGVQVDDNKGGVAHQTVTIAVTDKPNQPPVITELSVWLPKSAGEMKIDPSVELYERPRLVVRILTPVLIHCSAQDPDGDQMTYSWTATEGQITDEDGPKIIWTAPTNPIRHIVTVTAIDDRGASSVAKVAFDVSCCK